MISGYITSHGMLKIKILNDTLDSKKYLGYIRDEIIPEIKRNFGENFVWQ